MPKVTIDLPQSEIDRLVKEHGQGNKRWRAGYGGSYWSVGDDGEVWNTTDNRFSMDNFRYEMGNYFRAKEEVEECLKIGWIV